MGSRTKIQWTDSTWGPTIGCSRVSEGCRACYAETLASRFSGPGGYYEGVAIKEPGKPGRWTGSVRLVPEQLAKPPHWRKPRRIFVDSMSDLFHENLSDEDRMRVFDVMREASHHSYQVLTKRPAKMLDFCGRLRFCTEGDGSRLWLSPRADQTDGGYRLMGGNGCTGMRWVWLGVSVENQATFDERVPLLMQTHAAVRFLSAEPLLGPIDMGLGDFGTETEGPQGWVDGPHPDWVIVGAESGHGARPMDLDWARSIRDQCRRFGIPLFVKQLSGKNGRAIKDIEEFPEDLRIREFPVGATG